MKNKIFSGLKKTTRTNKKTGQKETSYSQKIGNVRTTYKGTTIKRTKVR